jgi:ferredoxin-NADP reductase
LQVISARLETPTTRIVRLALGDETFPYASGQAALLGLPDGSERVPYSIASSPEESGRYRYLEFLLKLENDAWGAHLRGLRRGSRLAVEGPVGNFVFPVDPAESQFLFVAGGTGIAPLRSMICQALQAGVSGRLHLLYSARTPADFAYLPEMRRYARDGRLELAVNATREVPKRWPGRRGRITRDQLAPLVEDPATLCFVCGPAAMVDEVPRMLVEIGIEPKRIRVEEW